jgi:hypothetical protein
MADFARLWLSQSAGEPWSYETANGRHRAARLTGDAAKEYLADIRKAI